ncbi:MAG: glycosyltransferase family 2 protein [Pseudomonadota bacterium]
MQTGLVSVVVPTYNRAHTLGSTVDSILAQTYEPFELIVVDDGSQDHTAQVMDAYLKKDSRVTYLVKPNGGVASARNLGVRSAKGEFIGFCDSDDIWMPEKLTRQVPLFQDPAVTLVYAGVLLLHADGHTSPNIRGGYCEGHCFETLLTHNRVACSTALVRTAALNRDDLFNERHELQGVEDKHLWIRLARKGTLAAVREPLVLYRLSQASVSSDEERMLNAELLCLDDLKARCAPLSTGDEALFQTAYARVYRVYGRNLFSKASYLAARRALSRAKSLEGFRLRTELYYWFSYLPPALIQGVRRLRSFSGQRAS